MKRIILIIAMALLSFAAHAQGKWGEFERLMKDHSYKSAYQWAEKVYAQNTDGKTRLAAAYRMTLAANQYQEDAHETSQARYRELLPSLEGVEKALCHAFLGEYDSALAEEAVLKTTAVEQIAGYCSHDDGKSLNVTPTAFDVLVLAAQDVYSITDRERADLQRKLVDFHAESGDDVRLWHLLRWLDLRDRISNQEVSETEWVQLIDQWKGSSSPYVAKFYLQMAQKCESEGRYVEAVDYCNRGIAHAAKSEGGVSCANLKGEIEQVRINVESQGLTVMSGQPSLQRVRYRNTGHLWFRVVAYGNDIENIERSKLKAKLMSLKPVVELDVEVPSNSEYRFEESLVALPALPAGRYVLMVAPTHSFGQGFEAFDLHCTDMHLMYGRGEVLLTNRKTGLPIAGQRMEVVRKDYGEEPIVRGVAMTDANGRYKFGLEGKSWRDKLVIEREGYRLETSFYGRENERPHSMTPQTVVRFDRPIYHPGDTVRAAIVFYRSDGVEGKAMAGNGLMVSLYDPNGDLISCDTVRCNRFGIASVSFELPKDRLPGRYTIATSYGRYPLRVEEYKQPTFMVNLAAAAEEAPAFGKEATMEGMAMGYNGVPVSDGRVQYEVRRRQLNRWWWCWSGADNEEVVAQGECETKADGRFAVRFTPEPDSNVELKTKPTFEYVVEVDVTDLAGESHHAEASFKVGFANAFLALEGSSTPSDLKVRHFDINGNDLPGAVEVKVERLQPPATPLLDSPLNNGEVKQTLSEVDFARQFPLLAYDSRYNSPETWQGKETNDRTATGVYRITLSASDADTVVEYRTVVGPTARRLPTADLLWAEVSNTTAEVGSQVELRFGSRFKGVQVYYSLSVGAEERDFRRIELNDEIKHLTIAVDEAMLGGFDIRLMTVKEGVVREWHSHVQVPFSHKELKVEIATFRDKLLPGEQEQWTLKVAGQQGGTAAAVVMTMYDDALNSYGGKQSWTFSPWRSNSSDGLYSWSEGGKRQSYLKERKYSYYNGGYPTEWRLTTIGDYYGLRRGRRMMLSKTSVDGVYEDGMITPGAVPEAEARMVNYSMFMADMSEADVEESAEERVDNGNESQLRTNLNTLAFFAPCILTDADGSATYTFTMPELLTTWNVCALAITPDIKIGTLDRTLITSKPLMVQPNVPRFLRSGDTMQFLAKVVANAPEMAGKQVKVRFELTDAATGETICSEKQSVELTGTAQVRFDVEVPHGVHVATYRVVAETEGASDGEQGQLVVLTNQELITVSQALFINGAGEKRFRMEEWLKESPTRQPEMVAAEVVSHPVWLAIKSLPYLKALESPSTTYLASQLYVNRMGQEIVHHYVSPEALEVLAEGGESRLSINEDIKQTLLKNSPWMAAATSEEEQMKEVARFLSPERLATERKACIKKLTEQQNSDGGWSWMPQGRSSLWTTTRVLELLAGDTELKASTMVKRALEYIDREQEQYYKKHILPYLKKGYHWQPVDVDYLYVRSFYGSATTKAYNFYYTNAKTRYADCEYLYCQAQFALIFMRNGDAKLAKDMVRRIKEKSLESEEMGVYWRDNISGWFWYERPIETQAMLIQAFAAIVPNDTIAIGQMQQWLLKQKQTTHWGNDMATVSAVSALLVGTKEKSLQKANPDEVALNVFGQPMVGEVKNAEGYRAARWFGETLDTIRQHGNDEIVVAKRDKGIAWGAVYYQFTDDIDNVPHSEMGIRLKRTYQVQQPMKVGDRVKVRIDIHCDRAMDYLEIVDGRPACAEPLSTQAGWRWNEGLSYYIAVDNATTRCYVEHIDKGDYYLEYDVYITNPGSFLAGTAKAQCMYAPEFRAVAPGQRLIVK